MRQDAPEIQLSSCSGPQPFQPGTSSRRPRNLQTETLGCVGQMARSRGLTAAWVWACCAIRRRPAVTLTMPRRDRCGAAFQIGAQPRDFSLQRPDPPAVPERDEESDRSQEEEDDADDPEKNDTIHRR